MKIMALYSFFLEPIRTDEEPTFLKAITEPDSVRPIVGDEFTVPPSRIVYRIVRVLPVGNPGEPINVSYFSVVVGSRADRPQLTGMDAKGL